MKPRDWGVAALRHEDLGSCRPPTFELAVELTQELLGRPWTTLEDLQAVSGVERSRLLAERAETYLLTAERLGYSFIRLRWFPTMEDEGGGYIHGSCNSIFPGASLENYLYMLDLWRARGPSPLESPHGNGS